MAAFASAVVGSARDVDSTSSIPGSCDSTVATLLRPLSVELEDPLRFNKAPKLVRDNCLTSDRAPVDGLPPGCGATTSLQDFREALESEVRKVGLLVELFGCRQAGESLEELESTEVVGDEVEVVVDADDAMELGETDVVDTFVGVCAIK